VALGAVGAGSFAYHGPQPSWAELAHDRPIVAVGAVYFAGLAQSVRRQQWSAWVTPDDCSTELAHRDTVGDHRSDASN
jgi:hypothetical protein